MQIPLRKSWFRVLVVGATPALLLLIYPFTDAQALREGTTKALHASTLLFAVCTALSLAVLNNYVKGLKDTALKHASEARNILEDLYDEFHDSNDQDLKEIVNEYIIPLLCFATPQWLSFDPLKPVLGRVVEPLTRVVETSPGIAPRYFLRLEDEINQLGLLYVRRVVSDLHARTIEGSFLLVCAGIVGILAVGVMPLSPMLNYIAIALAIAIVVFAILELLLLVSYVKQEAREELPDHADDGDNIEGEEDQELPKRAVNEA